MRHETLYNVLNTINTVVLSIIGIPFFLQVLYMLFFRIKKKTFPKSEKKGKVAYVICAYNEEDVIFQTVKSIKEKQNYPKELIDVYIVCHNCTDKTAELAEKAGGIPLILNDPDPNKKRLCYPIDFGFKYLIENDKGYDFIIRIDADNHMNDDFTSLMNDAYQSGVKLARPYESGLNMTQNKFTEACGLYYVFDSRFSSRVRERLHIGAHVNGPGMMVAMETIKEVGGYPARSISDDVDFNILLMEKNVFGHFVEDAVIYEDFPSTLKDTYNRNKRIGCGVARLIFGKLGLLAGKFFYKFKFSYLELFLSCLLVIISVILCTWIPLFYVYDLIYLGLAGQGIIATSLGASYYWAMFNQTWQIMLIAVGVLFVFCGYVQAFLLIFLDYKKMGVKRRRDLFWGGVLFPVFSVVYIATIAIGAVSKPSWNKVARNPNANQIDMRKS